MNLRLQSPRRVLLLTLSLLSMACGETRVEGLPSTDEVLSNRPSADEHSPSDPGQPGDAPQATNAPGQGPLGGQAEVEADNDDDEPVVDLLRATSTRLATSSAYRDRPSQVALLADGNVETAWNSRTGDLVGGWIEFEVPDSAHIAHLAIIVGYTKQTASRDLFAGNHRISRIRVSRQEDDGEYVEVDDYDLDPNSRELQEILLEEPGGRFRIEVLSVVEGERPDWRELCVSELRVMGTVPNAQPGTRLPQTSVGVLSAQPASETAAPCDDSDAAHRHRVAQLRPQVEHYLLAVGATLMDRPDVDGIRDERRRFLRLLAPWKECVSPEVLDAIRLRESVNMARGSVQDIMILRAWTSMIDEDLQAAIRLGDETSARIEGSRCRWERWVIGTLLQYLMMMHMADTFVAEGEGENPVLLPEVFDDALDGWYANSRGFATRLARAQIPDGVYHPADTWRRIQQRLPVVTSACGW